MNHGRLAAMLKASPIIAACIGYLSTDADASSCQPVTPGYAFAGATYSDGSEVDGECGGWICTFGSTLKDNHHIESLNGRTADDQLLFILLALSEDTGTAVRVVPTRPLPFSPLVLPLLGACARDTIGGDCPEPDLYAARYEVVATSPETGSLVEGLLGAEVVADNDRLEIRWGVEGDQMVYVYLRLEGT